VVREDTTDFFASLSGFKHSVAAYIAGITDAIAIRICLVGINGVTAVVAFIPHSIAIGVCLARVSHVGAVIAGIANAISIGIGLVRVMCMKAVVTGGYAVAIQVIERIVTGITCSVTIGVRLVWIG
jgi:hypothetical protein